MQFHISDILSILLRQNISQPDCPPIGDGGKLPNRTYAFQGTAQLMNYIIGDKIAVKEDGETFSFDQNLWVQYEGPVREAICQQCPQLAAEFPQLEKTNKQLTSADIKALAEKCGAEYLEISPNHTIQPKARRVEFSSVAKANPNAPVTGFYIS